MSGKYGRPPEILMDDWIRLGQGFEPETGLSKECLVGSCVEVKHKVMRMFTQSEWNHSEAWFAPD